LVKTGVQTDRNGFSLSSTAHLYPEDDSTVGRRSEWRPGPTAGNIHFTERWGQTRQAQWRRILESVENVSWM